MTAPEKKSVRRWWICGECRRAFTRQQDATTFHFLPGAPSDQDPRVYCSESAGYAEVVPAADYDAERRAAERLQSEHKAMFKAMTAKDEALAAAEARERKMRAVVEAARHWYSWVRENNLIFNDVTLPMAKALAALDQNEKGEK